MEHVPEYKERTGSCAACGNSAVQHQATFCIATVYVWQASLMHRIGSFGLIRTLDRTCRRIFLTLEESNYRLWRWLGLIRFGHDPEKAASYRSRVMWDEALRRGIPMEQIVFLRRFSDVYRAYIGGRWVYFESLPIPHALEQDSYGWLDDKYLLNRTLAAAGIPMPALFSVATEAEARRAFADSHGRAVVKPRSGSRGRHTTTNVRSEEDVVCAFKSARQLGRYVCVGAHVDGGVCRGTVVDGKLVGFFEAHPPRVMGDGASSIRELVAAKNAHKPERVQDITLTDEYAAFIARSGYTFDTILPKGVRTDLSHRTGRLFGGETRELLKSVHPRLRDYLEKAAQALNVPVVGFDLIIENPEKDPDAQEWGIIEANSLPFIDLHYLSLYGEPSNVAAHVWDLWNEKDPAVAGPSYATSLRSLSNVSG